MQQETGNERNHLSTILPLVVAAFAGASLAIACERPDSRATAASPTPQTSEGAQQPATAARPEAPVAQASTVAAASDSLSDTMITGRIRAAILTDPAMAGSDISVNTDRGVVSLLGSVRSHEQIGIASGHAQREDGVMRVDSHLAATPQ